MPAKSPAKTAAATVADRPVKPFWRKQLEEFSTPEWESLCDGCGRCCLVKLEDEDTGDIHFTNVACKLFDSESCRCRNYPARRKIVRDCVKLTPAAVRALPWLPRTCAYRLVAEGKDLKWWHPLVSGRPESVHEAGISVRGRVGGVEGEVKFADFPNHIVDWPNQMPRPRKPKE